MMQSLPSHYTVNHRTLHKFAIFIFICILVFHGTYFRIRPEAAAPTMDWLVFARLLTCAMGFMVGIVLLPRNIAWGFGAKILLFYVLATGISAINSPYPATVIGYFILLLGASVLMIALVYHAKNIVQLEKIEKIWFFIVSAFILKDTVTSLIFQEMRPAGEVVRLGMGVTHANALSFLAGLIFWISFTCKRSKYPLVLWLWRVFLLYVIIAAVSRVSIAAFVIGGLCYILFRRKEYLNRWIVVFSCVGILVTVFALGLSFDQSWASDIVGYLTRRQDKTSLSTFSARTDIWQNAANQSLESPIIGHGYGVSRLTMGPLPNHDFQPMHCHNEVLEVFFTTGLLGLIPFLLMFVYSLNWLRRSSWLSRTFSTDFTLHAICVVVMLLVSSIFEARIGGKLFPTHLLFFFYLLTMDRAKHFERL
jgi:O-antigen ligase